MSVVFKTQTGVKISLETGVDNSAQTDKLIRYGKPSGIVGDWVGTLNGTKVEYTLQAGDIDEVGVWRFQSRFVTGASVSIGKIVTQYFESPIV